jgi:hypothetical protein
MNCCLFLLLIWADLEFVSIKALTQWTCTANITDAVVVSMQVMPITLQYNSYGKITMKPNAEFGSSPLHKTLHFSISKVSIKVSTLDQSLERTQVKVNINSLYTQHNRTYYLTNATKLTATSCINMLTHCIQTKVTYPNCTCSWFTVTAVMFNNQHVIWQQLHTWICSRIASKLKLHIQIAHVHDLQ